MQASMKPRRFIFFPNF